MQTGALWKYVKERGIYHCPTGYKGELITYECIDSMNGLGDACRGIPSASVSTVIMKNINQIKQTAKRIVYLDTGRLTPDSFAVVYGTSGNCVGPEAWFDYPMARHGMGTNASFADGHSARWMWQSKETVNLANSRDVTKFHLTPEAKQDIYKIQVGCWGKLGYTPSITPKIEDE
jgi:prepilin-type processing-associated H-X9-DG protein